MNAATRSIGQEPGTPRRAGLLRIASLTTVVAALCALPALAGAQALATASDAERVVRSSEGFARERTAPTPRNPDELAEQRTAAAEVQLKPRSGSKQTSRALSVGYDEAWVYDATTEVFFDYDGDGYYHYLRVSFDADTVYTLANVYAEIYVSADGETWEHLYTTDDFAIYGSDPDDDYEVETELVSGYITALYDVLIELYDADFAEFVGEYGPRDSSAFSLLPLEDSVRDGLNPPAPPAPPAPAPPPAVIVDGGGGALSWAVLPGLLALALWRRRRAG